MQSKNVSQKLKMKKKEKKIKLKILGKNYRIPSGGSGIYSEKKSYKNKNTISVLLTGKVIIPDSIRGVSIVTSSLIGLRS